MSERMQPLAQVAADLGLDEKRLKGWIYYGYSSIRYPIGDAEQGLIDRDSLDAFLKRRADQGTDAL